MRDMPTQLSDTSSAIVKQILAQILAEDGLVCASRKYRLTPLGLRFLEPIAALAEWAKSHQKDLKPIFIRRNAQRGDAQPSNGNKLG